MNKKEKLELLISVEELEKKLDSYNGLSKDKEEVTWANTTSYLFLILGIILVVIMGGTFISGIFNPSRCGSGDCINSNNFYLYIFFPAFVGLIMILLGLIIKLFERKETGVKK